MIFTNAYDINNPKLDNLTNIIQNTRLEHDKKYGEKCCRKIEVRCIFKCFDKMKNKRKNIMIKHYHVQF